MKPVNELLEVLRSIPGALLDEPNARWESTGDAIELWTPEALTDEQLLPFTLRTSPKDDRQEEFIPLIEFPPGLDDDISIPLLDVATAEKIRKKIDLLGIDALAWYVPFHQLTYRWGCFVSLSGLCALADEFLPLRLPPRRRVELALNALLRHEATHFAVEYMAAQLELIGGVKCYWPANQSLVDPELRYVKIEEKLANAYMLRGFKFPNDSTRSQGALDLLRNYTRLQPPGYSQGEYFLDRDRFLALMSDLAHEYALSRPAQAYNPPPRGFDFTSLYPSTTSFDYRALPIYLVHDSFGVAIPTISIRFIPRIGELIETEAFEKKISRMDVATQNAWGRTKRKLEESTSFSGLDFKTWDRQSGIFSVRVTSSVRAHLQLNRSERVWSALMIGNHAEMGHG